MSFTKDQLLALDRLPGNTPWESLLLQAYVRDHGDEWVSFDPNYRLGTGLDPGPGHPESIRAGSIANTQKRIDLLANGAAGVGIVEGKITVDLGVYGQFEGYAHILQRERPEIRHVQYVVAAHAATPDTVGFLRSRGVQVYLYPDVMPPPGR